MGAMRPVLWLERLRDGGYVEGRMSCSLMLARRVTARVRQNRHPPEA